MRNTLDKYSLSASEAEREYFSEFLGELLPNLNKEFDKWFNYESPSMVDDKKGWRRAQNELDASGKTNVDFDMLLSYFKEAEQKAIESNNLLYFMKLEDLLLSLCSDKEKRKWKK